MCEIYKGANAQEELSIAQISGIFDFLRRLGVIYVSIGGGEPFLREDLPLIIRLLRDKGFLIRLLTNGTLVDECLMKDLAAAGLREVSVSLDTLDPQKQEYICNYQGAWDKIMKGLKVFSAILPKKAGSVMINTVVSALNIKDLPELAEFAKREGYHISFVPIEAGISSEFNFKESDHPGIDESYNYLINMKKKNGNSIFNSSLFLESSRQYLRSGQRNWQCDAGKLYFSLSPKGDISACHKIGRKLSLLQEGNRAMFVSKDFKQEQQCLIENCSGCMRPCWSELSFLARNMSSLREMCVNRIYH
jgi:MoaA/NifB/PqqE/SkfB family radical SAM enzyme